MSGNQADQVDNGKLLPRHLAVLNQVAARTGGRALDALDVALDLLQAKYPPLDPCEVTDCAAGQECPVGYDPKDCQARAEAEALEEVNPNGTCESCGGPLTYEGGEGTGNSPTCQDQDCVEYHRV